MRMKQGTLWTVLVIIVLALVGWWFVSMNQDMTPPTNDHGDVAGTEVQDQFLDDSKDSAPDPKTTTDIDSVDAPASSVTVRYTASGFSPALVTVHKGTKVTFVNESAGNMWVGADQHPTHTEYDGTSKSQHCIENTPSTTSFDQCMSGASYTFTFTKIGTWGYHNHAGASHKGTIVVTD